MTKIWPLCREPAGSFYDRRQDDVRAGTEDLDEDVLEVLPPIETILAAQDGMTHGQRVAVRLKAEVTEIGTLLLSVWNETDRAPGISNSTYV